MTKAQAEDAARGVRLDGARADLRAFLERELFANVPMHHRAGLLMLLSEVAASMYAADNRRTGISAMPKGLALYAIALHLFGRSRMQAVGMLIGCLGMIGVFHGTASVVQTVRMLLS